MSCRCLRVVVPLLLALLLASPGLTQTWDFVDNWSIQNGNPNGQWSYGWWAPDMSQFNIYPSPTGDPAGIMAWYTSSNESLVLKNAGPAMENVGTQWLEHNQGLMHPGQNGEKATARWTSSISGIVSISAHFSGQSHGGASGNGTTTDVHVLRNGVDLYSGLIDGFAGRMVNNYSDAFGPSPNQYFSGNVSVGPGTTIDFLCGRGANGTYFYDITGIDATITVVPTGPRVETDSIANAKTLADGTIVVMTAAKSVTAGTGAFADGSVYVEEPDRCSGIRAIADAGSTSIVVGDLVKFEGIITTEASGEKIVHLLSVTKEPTPGPELKPLGMSSRSAAASAKPDVTGLLVRTFGTVKWKSPDGSFVTISDGGKNEVRVLTLGQTLPIWQGSFVRQTVAVTGLAGLAMDGGNVVRTIRPRGGADVQVIYSPQDAQATARAWIEANIGADSSLIPFSFKYEGQSSATLLPQWQRTFSAQQLDENRTQRTVTYTDPSTKLKVECVAVEYKDFPTVEWTLYFTNTGSSNTPIIEQIKSLDTKFSRGDTGEFVLHYNNGDNCSQDSYAPREDILTPGRSFHTSSSGGRPTTGGFPYFNIEEPSGGVIAVISWAGQWAADFTRDQANGLRVSAGQEQTCFRLYPGERVQQPMAVLQFYNGDWIDAQNTWRRWMVKHNLPKPNNAVPPPMTFMCVSLYSTWEEQKAHIDKYLAENIPLDYWWQDAGWYPCPPNQWYAGVGTWEPDYTRYPGGIRQMSDYVHERGLQQIVWFEPERVYSGTWLALNHPEWIYGGSGGGLLKLGDPACWSWLVEKIDGLLVSEGIDLYRQDFNIEPLGYWRGNDPGDRQGITEIKHVMAYYAYWDELHRRHPNMIIDSCASGGRRNNLETLRRALPLLRSDYQNEPIGQQCHEWATAMWIPFIGTGVGYESRYYVRSSFSMSFGVGASLGSPPEVWADMRDIFAQWEQVSKYMLSDFYPLTPFSLATDVWMGWQFNDPEKGEGYVHAFRRPNCTSASQVVCLRGLDRDSDYALTNLDTSSQMTKSGAELMDQGLPLTLTTAPADVLMVYKRVTPQ